jgi:hypothetical protein
MLLLPLLLTEELPPPPVNDLNQHLRHVIDIVRLPHPCFNQPVPVPYQPYHSCCITLEKL